MERREKLGGIGEILGTVIYLGLGVVIFTFLFKGCQVEKTEASLVEIKQIDDSLAIRAIIGEASGEGYQGMFYVAVALRNRGTLKGVYGLNAKHVDKEPQWVWDLAKKAWEESKHNRIHTGTHWENIQAFGTPYWAKEMVVVARQGHHIFYALSR